MVNRLHPTIPAGRRGFTLIELLVVMVVLALLLTLATPRYFDHLKRAREAVLRENLATVREAIDRYHADRERYPDSLDDLVQRRYLRALPVDPILEANDQWTLVRSSGGAAAGGLQDIRSGATDVGSDGTRYDSW